MGNEQIERWCSMKEISEYLGITRDTALSWIEKRGMPGVKVGRTYRLFLKMTMKKRVGA